MSKKPSKVKVKNEILSFAMPVKYKIKLKEYASKTGRSASSVIRYLVIRGLRGVQ